MNIGIGRFLEIYVPFLNPMKGILSITLILVSTWLMAQKSEYGAGIFTHGDLRILVIYAEIEYEDEQKNSSHNENWPRGSVPRNAGEYFDSDWSDEPQGRFSKYYHQMSLGEFRVAGDYLKRIVTVRESAISNVRSHRAVCKAVAEEINRSEMKFKVSDKNLSPADFDFRTKAQYGKKWNEEPNGAFDHVMIFIRNFKDVWWSEGHPGSGLGVNIFGMDVDGYLSYNTLSFDIIKHEFGHFLLGGNNFHCCGGHDNNRFPAYWPEVQSGWGLMGNAGSSIKTINAFERKRLNWKGEKKKSVLSTGPGLLEKPSDLDALNLEHEGAYMLRDFITTGDAIRIKLPFLPEHEYQQWLWLENHQGISEFDNHDNVDCQTKFQPGIYAYVQIDKEDTAGPNTFRGHADYLKFLPAMGFYDVRLDSSNGLLPDYCIWGGKFDKYTAHFPVEYLTENPFSGNSDLQNVAFDRNGDGKIEFGERMVNYTEIENGKTKNQWSWRGHTRHAFHLNGNNRITIGSNPSSATHRSRLYSNKPLNPKHSNHGKDHDNLIIHHNGIWIELLKQNDEDGTILVGIQFDKPVIDEDTRWAADSIIIHNLQPFYDELPEGGSSLVITESGSLTINRNQMPSRKSEPEEFDGHTVFSSPTHVLIEENAQVLVKSNLTLKDDSILELMPGAIIILESGKLELEDQSQIIIHPGASVIKDAASEWTYERDEQVKLLNN